ncbi:MAG: dTDP-4-dehydrorhamnose reductase [Alphaproteobacteria bacterium]|nr:dTDP-4-dehydrorhamnose reductase [Alphaproteobacteria bacterium]
MKILLFGEKGQVATEIRRRAGADARAVGRAECDLAQPGAASRIIEASRADVVINAAAYTAVDRAESDERTAYAVNADAPGEMAKACAARGLPFIHFSTDYVFDGAGARPYRESDETRPVNVYGASKREGERLVASTGGAFAILRLSWVFSAHGANFVKTMLRLGKERRALRVVADQRGKPTPAGAAAGAALAAAEALAAGPEKAGLYHFAGDEETTWADFAETIFREAGLNVAVERIATAEYPTPARRPLYSTLDTSKFEKSFAVAPPSWRAALTGVIGELGANA